MLFIWSNNSRFYFYSENPVLAVLHNFLHLNFFSKCASIFIYNVDFFQKIFYNYTCNYFCTLRCHKLLLSALESHNRKWKIQTGLDFYFVSTLNMLYVLGQLNRLLFALIYSSVKLMIPLKFLGIHKMHI